FEQIFLLPLIGTGEEIRTQYQQLAQALDEFVRKTFNEWTSTVDKESHQASGNSSDATQIIAVLSSEERGLFRERIRSLDKKIHPGLTKLTWASKGISDYFIGECRNNCSKVQDIVDDYKNANLTISKNCKKISEMLLVKMMARGSTTTWNLKRNRLQVTHVEIVGTMKQTYEVFKHDGQEVQAQWLRYTEKMDRMVEEAFRLNVKWSLQELSRAISGDGKSAPNPLLRVKVVLEGDKPVYVIIERDEETKKIQASIKAGMSANASHLQSYLSTWDRYKSVLFITVQLLEDFNKN
ncbi:hypothetical protein OS493_040455, partial [Desmophyllum pertusum]